MNLPLDDRLQELKSKLQELKAQGVDYLPPAEHYEYRIINVIKNAYDDDADLQNMIKALSNVITLCINTIQTKKP